MVGCWAAVFCFALFSDAFRGLGTFLFDIFGIWTIIIYDLNNSLNTFVASRIGSAS